MKINIKRYGFLIFPSMLALLSSCLHDSEEQKMMNDYMDWYNRNTEYITKAETEKLPDGTLKYQKVTPKWDPSSFVLMQWHKRGDTPSRITPLDNSTIDVKYLLTNIDGDTIDSSYKLTTYGDSIFRCRPNEMITGFWVATTQMEVGDSVTAVIPYTSGYGYTGSGSVLPFSTLIFQIKLEGIPAYDSNPWRQ